jgi:DNA polymerase
VGTEWDLHKEKIEHYFRSDKRRLKTLADAEMDPAEVMHELILMRYTVMTYRARYPEVEAMWRDQEKAAILAVREPGRRVHVERGRCTWVVEGRFLRCYLPSGRALTYNEPKILQKAVPWNKNEKRPVLTFMAQNSKTNQWERQQTYGGTLVENITQATARDLMAEAMVRLEEHPDYDPVISVHDEAVAEADLGTGSVHEFEQIVAQRPIWAPDCPVEAEGWRGPRYRK